MLTKCNNEGLSLWLLGLSLVLILSLCGSAPQQAEIVIVHTNDFHGHLVPFEDKAFVPPPETVGGAAYLATKVQELRRKYPQKVILLDAGDIAQGTPLSNMVKGKPVIGYMNYLGYDAMTIGNHEFDWGISALETMACSIHFPLLCANIKDEKKGALLSFAKPYTIVEREGMKIGIIGVTTPQTPLMSFPRNVQGLTFGDPREAVLKYRDELGGQGIKVIGVLSHLGLEEDKILARDVPGLTFIIGGHSHTAVRRTEKINETVVVQAGCYGKYLGNLRLMLDRETGKVLFYNAEAELIPIITAEISPDRNVESIIMPYIAKIKPAMDEIIGSAKEDILNEAPQGFVDTPMGSFITDTIRANFKADLAVYNTGGVRAPLYRGSIRKGDVFNVLPFDNEAIALDLKGSQIAALLESLMDNPRFIQVSGMTFSFRRKTDGKVEFHDICIGGKPLEKDRTYRLATVDFIYHGINYQEMFEHGSNLMQGGVVRDLIEEHISQEKSVTPPHDRRIRILSSDASPRF
jgi:5'-nucleotidase / UDP-sugar diphosphatase